MSQRTYQATLHGDRLVWNGDSPDLTDETAGIAVEITLSNEPSTSVDRKSDDRAMAEALGKLAVTNALMDITDPVEWQREQRALPDRD
jgi:hypothetical protein